MVSIHDLVKHAQKFTIDNSPAILTAIGVVGSVTTAFLTAQATFKAAEVIESARLGDHPEDRYPIDISDREKIKLVWMLYIPAIGTGVMTCGAIIGANRIGGRRAAGLAAAYSLSEKAFSEYKDKVIETMGVNQELKVRDRLAQDRIDENPASTQQVIVSGGKVLCYEEFTGRYFESDMESIKKAQNDTNYMVNNNMYASLTDFYNHLGIAKTAYSDEVGWNVDRLLEVSISSTIAEDGKPCLSLGFAVEPIRGYSRLH